MKVKKYSGKYNKLKTDLTFRTLLDSNKELVRIIKRSLGTSASVELIERELHQVEADLSKMSLEDQAIVNPKCIIRVNGHFKNFDQPKANSH